MKVFGIGMFKTGTTSLEYALRILGFNHINNLTFFNGKPFDYSSKNIENVKNDYDYESFSKEEINKLKLAIDSYNAFSDHPWMWFFKKAYEIHPSGKFILTTRKDEETLANSDYNYWIANGVDENEIPNKEDFIYRYKKHNDEVRKYFKGNSNFIEICFENGDGWEEICNFLELPVPEIDFPHMNKGEYCEQN